MYMCVVVSAVSVGGVLQLSYIARPVSVDDILLLLSMSGEVVYELSIIMASSNYVAMHAGSHQPHGLHHSLCRSVSHVTTSDFKRRALGATPQLIKKEIRQWILIQKLKRINYIFFSNC